MQKKYKSLRLLTLKLPRHPTSDEYLPQRGENEHRHTKPQQRTLNFISPQSRPELQMAQASLVWLSEQNPLRHLILLEEFSNHHKNTLCTFDQYRPLTSRYKYQHVSHCYITSLH